MSWEEVQLGRMLREVKRPVTLDPDSTYLEIGIRSHGKGIFHKEPITGLELGSKKVFYIHPGDFVLNIVFAWEGAVAIAGEAERGRIGSHRFPTYLHDETRLDPRFLLHYFRTTPGLELLLRVSPGGAGRNRTLGREAFLRQAVPLPSLAEQGRIVEKLDALLGRLAGVEPLGTRLYSDVDGLPGRLAGHLIGAAGRLVRLNEIVTEPIRNGIAAMPSPAPPGMPILRISAATSSRDGIVNEQDYRFLDVPRAEVERYLLRQGDLLACRFNGNLAYVGHFAEVAGKTGASLVYPDKLIRFRLDPDVAIPAYVRWYMNTVARPAVAALCATTAGNIGLSAQKLGACELRLPPLTVQRQAVAALDASVRACSEVISRTLASRRETLLLRNRILSHAFTDRL